MEWRVRERVRGVERWLAEWGMRERVRGVENEREG